MTNNCNTYSLEEYMKPYWNSKVIYNESIMPLESSVGHMKPISLMYDIAQILSVKSASLEIFYEEGKDYVLEEGKLKILSSGDIRTIKYRFMYPLACDNSVLPDRRHGYMFFSEGSKFHNMQLAVTYIPKGNWEGETPTSKGFLLPKTMRKLRVGEELKIILYGDSISVGANSTKFVNTPPYCANYIEMLVDS